MTWLKQPCRIDLYGTPTLLLHGDSLCTRDVQYQRYRARVSDPGWQQRILRRPVWFRRGLATLLRAASRMRNRRLNGERDPAAAASDPTDAAPETVVEVLREHTLRRMIHGHTHRPAHHRLNVDGTPCERIVLGDWYAQGSVLRASPDGLRLQSLPRD